MKHLKSIFLLSALLLLFVGNVGVNIFKHICEEDGVLVSYFIDSGKEQCEDEGNALSCCKEEKEKDDCCSDEVEFFKIKLDFFDSNSFSLINDLGAGLPCELITAYNTKVTDDYTSNYVNPPPLESREILLLKQVFII